MIRSSVSGAPVVEVAPRRRAVRASLAFALLATAAAAAHAEGLDLAVFTPTPSTTGTGFQVQSPDVGPAGSWVLSSVVSYASNPLVLDGQVGDVRFQNALVKTSSGLHLGLAYVFLDRFEAGAHIPLYQQTGDAAGGSSGGVTRLMLQGADGTAVGNLAVHVKARLARASGGFGSFALGAGANVTIPTADKEQFTGSDQLAVRALLLAGFTPAAMQSRLTLTGNVGPVVRGESEYANIVQKSGVAWGIGASVHVVDPLWITAEVFGEATPSGKREMTAMGPQTVLAPIEALAGLHFRLERRVAVGLAVGRGVTDALGTPELRGVLSLSFVPGAAEVAPVHPPEPVIPDVDSDGDGIVDRLDKCPQQPEDKDMFQDDDGCPELDNDGDGIADTADKCPLDAEDKDGFQDDDGCPDKDNDGDGVPDTADKCANEPEDKDGVEDLDGCPELDNDRDGIPDAQDKCPNEPETINGNQDNDGCPDKGDAMVVLSPDRIETLDPIQFNGNKLPKASVALLEQVAATLRAHSEIVRVRVTVHVQPTSNEANDQAKSEKRAQAVRDWLVQWGIAATRVEARGFGGRKPLVPVDQRGAAKINDRLELIILERK